MITFAQATSADEFWHTELQGTNKPLKGIKGEKPLRARRNGLTQTWVKYPGLFRIPVKYGLKLTFYIQNFSDGDEGVPARGRGKLTIANAHKWAIPEQWDAERELFRGIEA